MTCFSNSGRSSPAGFATLVIFSAQLIFEKDELGTVDLSTALVRHGKTLLKFPNMFWKHRNVALISNTDNLKRPLDNFRVFHPMSTPIELHV